MNIGNLVGSAALCSAALLFGCAAPNVSPPLASSQRTEHPTEQPCQSAAAEEILAAARSQQENGNPELSRKLLASNADQFKAAPGDYLHYLTSWNELDQALARKALPQTTDPKKSWDQTQGERYLRKAFDEQYSNRWYPGILKGVGYKTAEFLWKKDYVLAWLAEAENKVSQTEADKTTLTTALQNFDLLKKSEKDIIAQLDSAAAENFKLAERTAPLAQSCRAFLNRLAARRTDWLSYSVISPYLGKASLLAWSSRYGEDKWAKTQTLKKACEALGRCEKELLLECNQEVGTQFVEAYQDIRNACGKDTDLFEYLKVYQNFVEAIQQGASKKGGTRWLEQ